MCGPVITFRCPRIIDIIILMSLDYEVLQERLLSLTMDGITPDECVVSETCDNAGYYDFVFLRDGKTVGLVRLPCRIEDRNDLKARIRRDVTSFPKV